jgi:hypothetical protein
VISDLGKVGKMSTALASSSVLKNAPQTTETRGGSHKRASNRGEKGVRGKARDFVS